MERNVNDIKSIILVNKHGKARLNYKVLGKPLVDYTIDYLKEVSNSEVLIEDKGNLGKVLESMKKGDIILTDASAPQLDLEEIKQMLENHKASNENITFMPDKSVNICLAKVEYLKSLSHTKLKDLFNSYNSVSSSLKLMSIIQAVKNAIHIKHIENGVTIIDPTSTYIERDVFIGYDTVIGPGCMLKSGTKIGKNCIIGHNSNLENTRVDNNVLIENSVIRDSHIKDNAVVGPYAYIRPDSVIGKGVKIGDFVEIKNATIGDNTQISHLTYVGDADVGKNVNFGCGSVLVNYDGVNKHRSTIEDDAFIGCNTNIVSPVNIGKRAFTAAGSTITKDLPSEALGISRVKQENKEGWVSKNYPKTK